MFKVAQLPWHADLSGDGSELGPTNEGIYEEQVQMGFSLSGPLISSQSRDEFERYFLISATVFL